MATVVQLVQDDPEAQAERWLHAVPAKYLACRGFGHAFPKPGDKRYRKLFFLERDAAGNSRLNMICRDCGTTRYVVREPGIVIQLPAERYNYDRPPGYSVPKGVGKLVTRRDCANEAMRRYYEELEHPTGGEEMPRFIPEDAVAAPRRRR
jgi:hypothetical protein